MLARNKQVGTFITLELSIELYLRKVLSQSARMSLVILIVVGFYNYSLSFIIDARSFTVGELFQTTPGGVGIQTTNKTVLIPSYRFEADGKLVGWRICSESSGYVTLQVVTQ